MGDAGDSSSDSDDMSWPCKKWKQVAKTNTVTTEKSLIAKTNANSEAVSSQKEKFEKLKRKSETIREISERRLQAVEKWKSRRLVKKALKDPSIKYLVQGDQVNKEQLKKENEEQEWREVTPFLNVNSHLQGPISHGNWGPKTELEGVIDDALKEEDFEKAELLSDTLANKEFAGKICKAYAAKRYHDELQKLKEAEIIRQKKKIRWTFDAKERWQMKGNM